MPTVERRPRSGEEVFGYAERFFGFGDNPLHIEVILPNPERKRTSTLECRNYPVFKHEVSPDDMYSAIRVHSLLTAIYGEILTIRFEKDLVEADEPSRQHRVLIGAPYTNRVTEEANDEWKSSGGFYFGDDKVKRVIVGKKSRHKIEMSPDGTEIIADYCYVSRKRVAQDKIELIIAGLRAYGQMASYNFLDDSRFYKKAQDVVAGHETFQLVVKAIVIGRQVHDYDIVEWSPEQQDNTPSGEQQPAPATTVRRGRSPSPAIQKRDAEVFRLFDRGATIDEVVDEIRKKFKEFPGYSAASARKAHANWGRQRSTGG